MTKEIDLDYLRFIQSELLNRKHSHGHTHVDLDWLLKRLERGFTGVEPEPIQELDPEAERKRFSEDCRRVGLVGASNLSTSRRLRASLGDGPYTVVVDDEIPARCELFRKALSSISLAERDSTSSVAEKVRDMARIARMALHAIPKAEPSMTENA